MAEKTLQQTLIDKGWVGDFQAPNLVNLFKDWIPSEAPPNPLNSSSFDYGFQLGYNAYRNEILRSLQ
jgi:hypothetical protein